MGVAKEDWHPGELYPHVGFMATNMTRPAERVVAFYNQRGTAEQHIKEGKNSVTWTRLSCKAARLAALPCATVTVPCCAWLSYLVCYVSADGIGQPFRECQLNNLGYARAARLGDR